TPTIVPAAPAAFCASAKEPPMSPTPRTRSLSMRRAAAGVAMASEARASAREGALERVEQATVLRAHAHGYAEPFRQRGVRDRAHDDALLEQPLVDAASVADLHHHEVRVRRNVGEPQAAEAFLERGAAGRVERATLVHVAGVAERGQRCCLRERVHVERLAHAV